MWPRTRYQLLSMVPALVILALFIPSWADQDTGNGTQDGLMLLGADRPDLRRPPVPFDHDAHADEFDCLDCHHRFEDGENVLDPEDLYTGDVPASCAACHNDTPDDLMRAFHGQCATCHDGHDDAPKSCNGCHGD